MPVRLFRRLILPLALVLALGLAACGSDGGGGESSADAQKLLEEAFSNKIESAKLSLDAEIQVDGVPQLGGPIKVRLSGPFTDNGPGEIPSLDWDLSFSGAGQNFAAGATVTGDNAYVSFQGADFEVGTALYGQFAQAYKQQGGGSSDALAQLGIKPEEWLEDPKVDSESEDVAGEETTKISGEVDLIAVIEDLGKASDRMGSVGGTQNPLEDLSDSDRKKLEDAIEEASVDVYVSNDDKTVRRFVLDLEFRVPEEDRKDAGGAEGGSAKIDIELADVGEKQEISAPANPRPLTELLSRFGLGGELPVQ